MYPHKYNSHLQKLLVSSKVMLITSLPTGPTLIKNVDDCHSIPFLVAEVAENWEAQGLAVLLVLADAELLVQAAAEIFAVSDGSKASLAPPYGLEVGVVRVVMEGCCHSHMERLPLLLIEHIAERQDYEAYDIDLVKLGLDSALLVGAPKLKDMNDWAWQSAAGRTYKHWDLIQAWSSQVLMWIQKSDQHFLPLQLQTSRELKS